MEFLSQKKEVGLDFSLADTLSVIIFDFMNVKFAVDVEHISEIMELNPKLNENCQIIQLADTFRTSDQSFKPKSPKLLVLKGDQTLGILTDQPEDLVQVPLEKIRALPPFVEKVMNSTPIWAAFVDEDDIVYLLDCFFWVNQHDLTSQVM